MITIAANNLAVSHAIHRAGPRLCPKAAHHAYTAQLNPGLRSFYAKQTQFPKGQNEPNLL